MAVSLAEQLGAFVVNLGSEDIPTVALDRSKDRLLDAVSTAVAARDVATTKAALGAVRLLAGTGGTCTILPTGLGSGPATAALANGTAVHAILFEDINLSSSDHPGAVVVPAALSAAEACAAITGRAATIDDLVLGILAGYEVHLWLGVIAADGVRARGFRTTAVFGTVGAAAAVAKVLRMPLEETVAAIVLGANTAFGVLEGFAHGTMEPYLQAGLAAQNGLVAALIARSGAQTASVAFEGQHGYLRAFADTRLDTVRPGHDEWRILGVSCKPYPISGGKIAVVDSALSLVDNGLDASQIESVVAYLPEGIAEFPGGDKAGPFRTMNEAQDSTQFCVAAALLGRPMGSLEMVMHRFDDAEVAELTRRIRLVSEAGRDLSRVDVTLRDGTVLRGEGEWPDRQVPSIEKMADKLRSLTADAWTEDAAGAVTDLVVDAGTTSVDELTALLRGSFRGGAGAPC